MSAIYPVLQVLHIKPQRRKYWEERRKGVDWLTPKPLFLIIILLGVFLPSYSFLHYEDWFSVVWPFAFLQKNGTVFKAIAIYTSILVLFSIGYNMGRSRTRLGKSLSINDSNFLKSAFLLVSVGMTILLLILYFVGGLSNLLAGASDRTREFAGLQGLFLVLNILISVSLVWYIRILKERRILFEKTIFVLFLLASMTILALQGQKSTIFINITALAVIYNIKRRNITLPEVLTGSFMLFVALMAYHIYKQEYLVLGRVVSVSSGDQFWSSAYDFLVQQVFGNFMQLQTMSVLIEGMPAPLDYQYGYTYFAGLLLLVPRAFFPAKPLPSTGIFTEAFWPAAWHDLGTTLPPGIFGEAYMNFGLAGAVVAGLFAGFVMGRLHGKYLLDTGNDMALIYYAVMVAAMLHFFRGELASVLYLVLSIVLPCRIFMSSSLRSARV